MPFNAQVRDTRVVRSSEEDGEMLGDACTQSPKYTQRAHVRTCGLFQSMTVNDFLMPLPC